MRACSGVAGTITGGGLAGFGVTIIVLSFVADKIGYGPLMALAFVLHLSSALVTFLAAPIFNQYGKDGVFYCLNVSTWLFALGNGTCEAVINPLTATLFPKNRTHWLNILHAGWPGGLILGALLGNAALAALFTGFGIQARPVRGLGFFSFARLRMKVSSSATEKFFATAINCPVVTTLEIGGAPSPPENNSSLFFAGFIC